MAKNFHMLTIPQTTNTKSLHGILQGLGSAAKGPSGTDCSLTKTDGKRDFECNDSDEGNFVGSDLEALSALTG